MLRVVIKTNGVLGDNSKASFTLGRSDSCLGGMAHIVLVKEEHENRVLGCFWQKNMVSPGGKAFGLETAKERPGWLSPEDRAALA